MEQFVKFLKGFGVILLFAAVGIAAINTIATSPYAFIKACGVVALVVDFYVVIKRLKQGIK